MVVGVSNVTESVCGNTYKRPTPEALVGATFHADEGHHDTQGEYQQAEH